MKCHECLRTIHVRTRKGRTSSRWGIYRSHAMAKEKKKNAVHLEGRNRSIQKWGVNATHFEIRWNPIRQTLIFKVRLSKLLREKEHLGLHETPTKYRRYVICWTREIFDIIKLYYFIVCNKIDRTRSLISTYSLYLSVRYFIAAAGLSCALFRMFSIKRSRPSILLKSN